MLALCLVQMLRNKRIKRNLKLFFLLSPVMLSAIVIFLTKLRYFHSVLSPTQVVTTDVS